MSKPILIVEDTPDDVFFLQRAFKKAEIGAPIKVAEDGKRAIELLEQLIGGAETPDNLMPCLILLDLKLPHFHGLEVLAWIRKRTEFAALPVIVLTSSREERDIKEAYSRGANSFKVKPSDAAELAAFALAVKLYWLEHDEACVTCFRVR